MLVTGAYIAGNKIGGLRCKTNAAIEQSGGILETQTKIIKTKDKINEEIYNNNAADIRNWLRANYTIKDKQSANRIDINTDL